MTNQEIVKWRNTCVLYLTATCNLKCRYCYIDKSSALKEIDDILVEHYKGDYFFNFMKEMFPDPNQLSKIEMWGGEPSYGLPRALPTIEKALNYYPNLTQFMMSTNLTTSTWTEDFYQFISLLKNYPERHFNFYLQLSLDGPTFINDNNRGKGTTELFAKTFSKVLSLMDNWLEEVPNLSIWAHFKPTLDDSCVELLQSKEAIIDYYRFFEHFKEQSDTWVWNDRWDLSLPNPNMAVPGMHSKHSGELFANYVRLCVEIMDDGIEKYLKYPRSIVPFHRMMPPCSNNSLCGGCGGCGTGKVILGLLPYNLISSCHNGFVDLVSDYKIKSQEQVDKIDRTIDFRLFLDSGINNHSAYTKEEYLKYERIMQCFYNPDSLFQTTELAALIKTHAEAGQIESKYKNQDEAIKAANFIYARTSSCVRDNLGVTGSRYLSQPGYIRLFLNGAKEYLEYAEKF